MRFSCMLLKMEWDGKSGQVSIAPSPPLPNEELSSLLSMPLRASKGGSVGVEHRSTPSRQSVNALVFGTQSEFARFNLPAAFLWTLNGEVLKCPLKKMLPLFSGIPSEILDQHDFVAGLVVHQLIHHLFREQQAQPTGTQPLFFARLRPSSLKPGPGSSRRYISILFVRM